MAELSPHENYESLFGAGSYGPEDPNVDPKTLFPSPWTGKAIVLDPYGANPMIEALKVENPAVYSAAVKGDPIPQMFAGGDLPAFTASGTDPQALLAFPWQQRHAVAAEKDAARVYLYAQEHSEDPSISIPHPGLSDYIARCDRWARTSGVRRRYQNG